MKNTTNLKKLFQRCGSCPELKQYDLDVTNPRYRHLNKQSDLSNSNYFPWKIRLHFFRNGSFFQGVNMKYQEQEADQKLNQSMKCGHINGNQNEQREINEWKGLLREVRVVNQQLSNLQRLGIILWLLLIFILNNHLYLQLLLRRLLRFQDWSDFNFPFNFEMLLFGI